ncbi:MULTISPECIES: hypothetical protein [Vibrio]|uniref:hypothetical protein n=1 Tax=Vibrio TaxID=662 RepID=UPI001C2FA255|nr:hypothetical protein [Vibrio metschnikovii]
MNIDDLLEKVKSLEHRLFIKYSLVQHPTEAQIAKWYELTNQFISDGVEPEQAAKKAAFDSFEVDPSMIRKTQADTIEALLLMARKKVEEKTKDD